VVGRRGADNVRLGAFALRTSVGAMSRWPGSVCSLAMWVESLFIEMLLPQNLHSALPGEM
jgi:hypothetical protein